MNMNATSTWADVCGMELEQANMWLRACFSDPWVDDRIDDRKYDTKPYSEEVFIHRPRPVRAAFNKETTIVFFADGSKAIVKPCSKDTFDRERGIMYAIMKRYFCKEVKDGVACGGAQRMVEKMIKAADDQDKKKAEAEAKKAAKKKAEAEAKMAVADPAAGQNA